MKREVKELFTQDKLNKKEKPRKTTLPVRTENE